MFGEKKTECCCPKCGVIHERKMFWAGHGQPRTYCTSCRGKVKSISNTIIYGTKSGRTPGGPVFQS